MEPTVPAGDISNSSKVGVPVQQRVSAVAFRQKGSGKSHDLHPLIPSAGVGSAHDGLSAREVIHGNTAAPHTSGGTASYQTTSAAAFASMGAGSGFLLEMRSAGRATGRQGQSVGRLLSNQLPATTIGRFLLKRQEQVYRSVYSKPLGRSVPRCDLKLPFQDEKFRFGVKQTTDEIDAAKKLIFAPVLESTQEALASRKRTHHSCTRGETLSRGEAPAHVNMRTFRFGKKTSTNGGADAKQCIHWDSANECCKIVSKAIEDYHIIRHPEVGKCTRYATGRPPVPPEFSFGLPTAQDGTSAQDCLQPFVPEEGESRRAATNVGRCTGRGEHNTGVAPVGAKDRSFGIPSVRTDVRPPRRKSLDDHVNYGDEPAMGELLFPAPSQAYNLKDEDFLVQLSRRQIQDLLNRSIGTGDNVDLVYQAVDLAFEKRVNGTDNNRATSLEKFSSAYVSGSPGSDDSVYANHVNEAIGTSRPRTRDDGDGPTISLTDLRDAYVDLIKQKVALETRSLTQATHLYVKQPPAITFQ